MEKQSQVTSVFKNRILTKEAYTHIWIKLISSFASGKANVKSTHVCQKSTQ